MISSLSVISRYLGLSANVSMYIKHGHWLLIHGTVPNSLLFFQCQHDEGMINGRNIQKIVKMRPYVPTVFALGPLGAKLSMSMNIVETAFVNIWHLHLYQEIIHEISVNLERRSGSKNWPHWCFEHMDSS